MNWHAYYLGFATWAAQKSKDSTKVGAILIGPDGEIRLTAYNGPPRGVNDTPERLIRPIKYLYASHAEANLIAFAARAGISTAGCTAYVTHHPCASCARTLIQAGITKVVIGDGAVTGDIWKDEFAAAFQMFREAKVGFFKGEQEWTA
jgi:dCMP deaminase